jgi:sulfate/thiosulfate transport system permease protein
VTQPRATESPVVRGRRLRPVGESAAVKWTLILLAIVALLFFLVLPLATIFIEALRDGWQAYKDTITQPECWQSVRLTLLTAAIAVPLNAVFGVMAAWVVTKFNFRGKSFLLTLIDLPFSVSPVAAGLALVLIFGKTGWLGPWLEAHNLKVVYSLPGIILATVFVTFPFVARELIPLMQAQGVEEEEAAHVLGANAWQMFFRVTLPNIKWGLLYGIILCNARAMGEFGAVYAVSSNFEGEKTLPLYIERVYYSSWVSVAPAFAVSTLLAILAMVTLVVKAWLEHKTREQIVQAGN